MEQGRVETPGIQPRALPPAIGAATPTVPQGGVVYAIDRDYRITSVNAAWDAFATANGAAYLRSTMVVGTNLLDWIHGPPREETRQLCAALLAGEMERYDYHFDCSSLEERRIFAMTMQPLRDAQGAIAGIQFVSRNIVDFAGDSEQTGALAALVEHLRRQQTAIERAREEAEHYARAASEHAARLHATLGAMNDGVWICNQVGVIVSVNDAGLRMFGLRRLDVVGQPVAVLAHLFGVGRGERRRLGLRLALQGETMHTECDVSLRRNSAELTVEIRATPIRDDTGAVIGAVAVVRDLTETKDIDRLKEDFLSVAAHELKTPITALKGYTQLALKRTPSSSETHATRRALATIDEQADRITKLVQKLLDVSRIQSGRLELQLAHFDLQELIVDVAERAQFVAQAYLIGVEPHAPIRLAADYERIEQVLFNLVDNAIKYSPPGGTIRLAAEMVDGDVRVGVHDQGVGIPPDKLPHIFDRWYQAHFGTHGDYGGMGLGLYICKEIVEQHGGHMWAISSADEGTTIGFVLPLAPDGALQPAPDRP